MRACSGESALAQMSGTPASTRLAHASTDASTEEPIATTAMRNRLRPWRRWIDPDVAGVAVDDVADPAEELLGEEAVLLDGGDLVTQAPQLERRGRAEPAEPDDEDVVVVGSCCVPSWMPPSAGVVEVPACHAGGGE